ncbi:MAG: hypothetical protein KIS63_12995, partial [Caldilineales bacterium]|nr:hypothetical protein [Caldilineales bacterium]
MRKQSPQRRFLFVIVLVVVLVLSVAGAALAHAAAPVARHDLAHSGASDALAANYLAANYSTASDLSLATDIWRFRGTTYRGSPSGSRVGFPDVVLRLYVRDVNETAPGRLLQTVVSDAAGFFNFYVTPDRIDDYFRLVVEVPAGQVVTGVESEDGVILNDTTIEWFQPKPEVHLNAFYFNAPTPTPTPTDTPTMTPTPTDTPPPPPPTPPP